MRQSDEEDGVSLAAIYQEIREVYLTSNRDWIVAYSGGKDSTATLQLIWYALTSLPPALRKHHIFVVSNDTLVEDPAMAVRIHRSCQKINAAAKAEAESLAARYPESARAIEPLFSAHIVKPELTARFFYLLLGLGYPPPTVRTRWCVSRLKIEPAKHFIEAHIAKHHEVVLTLGAREEESTERACSLRKHALPNQLLKRHSSIHGAWVYTPIEVWSTEDVWVYLFQIDNPWGDENEDLAAIYRSSSGECPLVVDRKTPSCAGTRTGCWTCTVAKENRSLVNRVDAGEAWLVPLLQFRDQLVDMIDPAKKHLYRSLESRGSHRVELTRQGNPSYRCLTLETRQKLLRQLLLVQEQIRKEAPDPTIALIDFEELCAIREVWRAEGDWEDSLPHIYRQVTGHDEAWPVSQDEDWMNASTKEALLYHCQRRHLNPQLVIELLEAWKLFSRSMSVPREHAENQENAVELTPLFAEDPVTVAQQKAMRRLVEVVANLFENRDWRSHEERLAEVIAQHQTEQEQPSSCYTLPTWLPRRLKDE